MAYPPISTLPSPPSRQDPANFATEADAFLGALPTFQSQVNAAGTYIDGIGTAVDADAASASAAASAALATANVTLWVSGTNYAQGVAVYSPITFFTYRRKITGAGTTDPSLDSTNWALVVGTGDVTLDGVQTLTNKTLTSPTLNDGYTEEVFAVTGTTPALSPTNGSIQTWTLSGSSTPTAGTWNAGQSITLMIDDGSAATVTWTSLAVTWKTDGGVAPTLNTTGFTVVVLWKVGTTLYGARVGDA